MLDTNQLAIHHHTPEGDFITETYCTTPLSGPLKLLAERSVIPTVTSQPEDTH